LVGPEFKGKSSIYSPLELTDDHRGIIREAASPDDEAVVTADVDLDSVRSFKDRHPVFGAFNYDFYAQEFPGVYWGRPA
jgi:predicted amidohydrolase